MPGIYQRDNLANTYAANLERALARRDAYEKERAARVKSNVDALNNGLRAVGTAITYGLSEDPQERLAKLEKEYREAVAAEREQYDNSVRAEMGAKIPTYTSNPYLSSMAGYKTNYQMNPAGYSDYMGKAHAGGYDLAMISDFYRRGI